MRIKELVTEAISVTSYEGPLIDAIKQAIYYSVAGLRSLSGTLPKEEADLEDDDSSQNLFRKAITPYLLESLTKNLASQIKSSLNNSAGVPVVAGVEFEEISGNTRGYAQGRHIALNIKYAKSLTKRIIEYLLDNVYSSYNSGERAQGFYFVVRMIGSSDQYYASKVDDAVQSVIKGMSSTTIHELVHAMQHNQQELRGREDTEYRSYLDKRKGEMISRMNDRADATGKDATNDDRYYDLYMASPQEIAAFGHQAALNIVRDYGFAQATSLEDLAGVSPNDIMIAVNTITGGRFKSPRNPKEVMIRKRYLKLVYLEVQRYLEQMRNRLEKTSIIT